MTDNNYNYQQPIDPTQQAYVAPAPSYGANGESNASQPPQRQEDVTGLGVGSVVCSLLSFCCCGITGIVGLILGIMGLKRKKGDVLCIIGVILNALVIVFALIFFIYVISLGVLLGENPEAMQEIYGILEEYQQYV